MNYTIRLLTTVDEHAAFRGALVDARIRGGYGEKPGSRLLDAHLAFGDIIAVFQ